MRSRSAPFATLIAAAALACAAGAAVAKPPAPAGRSRLTFTERHPLGSADEVSRRVFADYGGLKDEQKAQGKYELTDESFEVFVPPGYKAGAPHGLFVFISAGEAKVAPDWFDVFSRHKLIWVCANNSGNSRNALVRIGLALDAVHNMKQRYDLDESRIYISGFSAGGQLATWMVRAYPDVFSGGCFLMGGSFYRNRKREDGTWEPTVQPSEPTAWNGPLDRLRKDLKLVIIKAERDATWTAAEGRADYESLLLDGFERVSFIEVPRLGHTHPNASWLEKAVVALEARPKKPPTTSPT